MKLYTSRGIIFRIVKYGESSIICDIYTEEKGLRSYIVSGIRNGGKRNRSAIFRPLNFIEIVAPEIEEVDKLTRIKEASLFYHFNTIDKHVVKSSIALFMLEVIRNTVRERHPDPEMFQFIQNWMIWLDDTLKTSPLTGVKFMLELASVAGFEPLNNYSTTHKYFDLQDGIFKSTFEANHHFMDEDISQLSSQLMSLSRENLLDVKIDRFVRELLYENWIQYYKMHLTGFRDIKTLDVLKTIF
jgi:DNA repair protein RecO (recombination protein O)